MKAEHVENGWSPVCGKRSYSTRAEAKIIVKRMKKAGGGVPRVYHCPLCKRWHVTSQRRREWMNGLVVDVL